MVDVGAKPKASVPIAFLGMPGRHKSCSMLRASGTEGHRGKVRRQLTA